MWFLVLLGVNQAFGHFSMLFPNAPSVKKGDQIAVVYQWGHPFEHQIFDAQPPAQTLAIAPDGKLITLKGEETSISDSNKRHRAEQFRLPADLRGDYVFLTKSAPIWMADDQEFLLDYAKVIVHVQAQKGWDASFSHLVKENADMVEMVPLTRPYGLQPGMTFQAQFLSAGKPQVAALVEIERYNPAPPGALPADEHITRTAKTDPNGIVTCTLTDPGWWCIAGQCDGGTAMRDGKSFPVRKRAILWVYVDEKVATNSSK